MDIQFSRSGLPCSIEFSFEAWDVIVAGRFRHLFNQYEPVVPGRRLITEARLLTEDFS